MRFEAPLDRRAEDKHVEHKIDDLRCLSLHRRPFSASQVWRRVDVARVDLRFDCDLAMFEAARNGPTVTRALVRGLGGGCVVEGRDRRSSRRPDGDPWQGPAQPRSIVDAVLHQAASPLTNLFAQRRPLLPPTTSCHSCNDMHWTNVIVIACPVGRCCEPSAHRKRNTRFGRFQRVLFGLTTDGRPAVSGLQMQCGTIQVDIQTTNQQFETLCRVAVLGLAGDQPVDG